MSRPVTDVRPLAIGAAWLSTSFECLAPDDLDSEGVKVALFSLYEFAAAGWKLSKMTAVEVGYDDVIRAKKWNISK